MPVAILIGVCSELVASRARPATDKISHMKHRHPPGWRFFVRRFRGWHVRAVMVAAIAVNAGREIIFFRRRQSVPRLFGADAVPA
jgi:hypothetical protein